MITPSSLNGLMLISNLLYTTAKLHPEFQKKGKYREYLAISDLESFPGAVYFISCFVNKLDHIAFFVGKYG
jgi:hypothetical protein